MFSEWPASSWLPRCNGDNTMTVTAGTQQRYWSSREDESWYESNPWWSEACFCFFCGFSRYLESTCLYLRKWAQPPDLFFVRVMSVSIQSSGYWVNWGTGCTGCRDIQVVLDRNRKRSLRLQPACRNVAWPGACVGEQLSSSVLFVAQRNSTWYPQLHKVKAQYIIIYIYLYILTVVQWLSSLKWWSWNLQFRSLSSGASVEEIIWRAMILMIFQSSVCKHMRKLCVAMHSLQTV